MGRTTIDIYARIFSLVEATLRISRKIPKTPEGIVIQKQLIRSVTSIGANASEASVAVSKPDFLYKLRISIKEAKETEYWLRLTKSLFRQHDNDCEGLLKELGEILSILSVITYKTSQRKK